MGLRARFTLWFSLAALLTIAVAAVVTRQAVIESFRRSHELKRDNARAEARGAVSQLARSVADTVRVMSEENPTVRGVLFELAHTGGGLSDDQLGRLKERSGPLMRELRLDVMFLIDSRGVILSAPHGGAIGEVDPGYRAQARRTGGEPYFASAPLLSDGQIRKAWFAMAARNVREGGQTLTVVGGRMLRPSLLAELPKEGVAARVVATDGTVIAESGVWDEAIAPEVIEVEMNDAEGARAAQLELIVSRAELNRLLRSVTVRAGLVGGLAVLLTVLFGALVARRITGDLRKLVEGVQAAARGDLAHRVPVRKKDEVGAVAASVNAMMADLKEANERLAVAQRVAAWQEIARRLAHEIKNPLTPIQMSVETMRKTRAQNHPSHGEIFDESTATILEEVGRLKRIVSEFSEFARLPKPNRARCDLNEVVRGCTALYKGSCEIAERLEGALPAIEADRDQLSQALLNLIENARDALTAAGRADSGRIAIETSIDESGQHIRLILEDNGAGFADQVLDKLFTPYFTTKHATGGTGLGLAITHRIISDHGGKITASNAPAGGARFVVQLPVA